MYTPEQQLYWHISCLKCSESSLIAKCEFPLAGNLQLRHLWSLWPLKRASAVCFRHLQVTGCSVCYPSLYHSPPCFGHPQNNQPLGQQIGALLKACGLPASRTTGSFDISLSLLSLLTLSVFQLFIFFLLVAISLLILRALIHSHKGFSLTTTV